MWWYFILLVLFGVIIYQDIRYRGIHWVVFPLLLMAGLFYDLTNLSLIQISQNVLILSLLLLSLTIYLCLKEGRLVNITKGYFSWGDILFLLVVTPVFETKLFLLFFVVGTIISLLLHILASIIKGQKNLPYAGYMSFTGIVFLVFHSSIQTFIDQVIYA